MRGPWSSKKKRSYLQQHARALSAADKNPFVAVLPAVLLLTSHGMLAGCHPRAPLTRTAGSTLPLAKDGATEGATKDFPFALRRREGPQRLCLVVICLQLEQETTVIRMKAVV